MCRVPLTSRLGREKDRLRAKTPRAEITILRVLRWMNSRIKVYYATRKPASPRTREDVPSRGI